MEELMVAIQDLSPQEQEAQIQQANEACRNYLLKF